MAEVPDITLFDATQSRIPWPDAVGPYLVDRYKEVSQEGRSPYWAIGKIVGDEGEGLSKLMLAKEDQEREKTGRVDRNSEESQILWAPIEGFRRLDSLTDWARMLDETDGDINKHPDYIATMGRPIAGVEIGDWDMIRGTEEHLRNQRILQAGRNDPLGRDLIRFGEEEMKRYVKMGMNTGVTGMIIGFRRAVKRYNQILDYLLENGVLKI